MSLKIQQLLANAYGSCVATQAIGTLRRNKRSYARRALQRSFAKKF